MTRYKLPIALIMTLLAAKSLDAGSPFDKFVRNAQGSSQRFQGRQPSRSKPSSGKSTPRFDTRMGLPQKYRSGSGGGNRTLPFPEVIKDNLRHRITDEIRRHVEPRPCPKPVILPFPNPCPEPVVDPLPSPCPEPIVGPLPSPCPQPIDEPVLPPSDVEMPAPLPGDAEPELPIVYEGQTIRLPVNGMGEVAGRISIKLGPISAAAVIVSWSPDELVFTAPKLGLADAANGTLVVAGADGSILGESAIRFSPPLEPQLPQVPVGSQLTLDGDGFGATPGVVWVKVGSIRLRATIISWTPNSTVIELPQLELAAPTAAELLVMTSEGHQAERADVQLVAAQ